MGPWLVAVMLRHEILRYVVPYSDNLHEVDAGSARNDIANSFLWLLGRDKDYIYEFCVAVGAIIDRLRSLISSHFMRDVGTHPAQPITQGHVPGTILFEFTAFLNWFITDNHGRFFFNTHSSIISALFRDEVVWASI
jgi:hypothetical protein